MVHGEKMLSRMTSICSSFVLCSGCKESHFYSLPFGQAEANIIFVSPNIISTSPKNVLMSRLISQFFCNLNSLKNFTCLSGKLKTEFTSSIAKSTSPGYRTLLSLICTLLLSNWYDQFFFVVLTRYFARVLTCFPLESYGPLKVTKANVLYSKEHISNWFLVFICCNCS